MTINETTVYNWLMQRIGEGYVWSADGEVLTEAIFNEYKRKQPDYVTDVSKKWIGKRVWDCASLVREAMKLIGIKMASGATSAWKNTVWAAKGTIDTLPKNQMAILYRQTDANTMQHTGVYMGDGTCIDARGSQYGVLHTKLEKYKWTHWGQPVGLISGIPSDKIEVIEVAYKAIVQASSGDTVNLRASASTKANRLTQVPVGSKVDVLEDTNAEWCKITYGTYTGYMMKQFLAKLESGTNDTKPETNGGDIYVRMPVESVEQGRTLVELLKKAEVIA